MNDNCSKRGSHLSEQSRVPTDGEWEQILEVARRKVSDLRPYFDVAEMTYLLQVAATEIATDLGFSRLPSLLDLEDW